MADDQGYQDLGCFGSPKIKTPTLTGWPRGHALHRLYSGAPVYPLAGCALTGSYAKRVGGLGVLFPGTSGTSTPMRSPLRFAQDQGYATACIGNGTSDTSMNSCPPAKASTPLLRGALQQRHDPRSDSSPGQWQASFCGKGYLGEHPEPGEENLVPLMRDTKIIRYPTDQNTLTSATPRKRLPSSKRTRRSPSSFTCRTPCPRIPLYATPNSRVKRDRAIRGHHRNSTGRPTKFSRPSQAQARSEHLGHLHLRQRSLEACYQLVGEGQHEPPGRGIRPSSQRL